MEKKSTTLEKQRALAASLGGGKSAAPVKKAASKKAAKKAAPKKRPAKKAKKAKAKKANKTKPIGARIKVVKSTKIPKKKAVTKIAPKKAVAKKVVPKAPKAVKPVKAAKPAKLIRSGQSAGVIRLECVNLNVNETKVIEAMRANKQPMSLVEIAKAAFPRKTRAQGNSWVRNAMRRLVRGALIIKIDRGTYKMSPKGQGVDKVRPQVLAASPKKVDPPSESLSSESLLSESLSSESLSSGIPPSESPVSDSPVSEVSESVEAPVPAPAIVRQQAS